MNLETVSNAALQTLDWILAHWREELLVANFVLGIAAYNVARAAVQMGAVRFR